MKLFKRALVVHLAVLILTSFAQAGVFNIPHFVTPGEYSLGLEPELVLTHGAGLAGNIKYTEGVSDLSNAGIIIGTGDGPRRFRVGANMNFDIFPDIEGQPGIGIAFQGLYYKFPISGRFEMTAIPYIHKTYAHDNTEIEPFFSVPFGVGFRNSTYESLVNVALGSMFKASEHFRYVIELGVNVNNSESYVSGGIIYFH